MAEQVGNASISPSSEMKYVAAFFHSKNLCSIMREKRAAEIVFVDIDEDSRSLTFIARTLIHQKD